MTKLEQLTPGALVSGLLASGPATVVAATWIGSDCINLTYRSAQGEVGQQLLYRDAEYTLSLDAAGRAWSFDADGNHFRLGAEALRIHLAHLFDPLLAVHTSVVDPLPHQITAVYECMLPRQPLRFLLADDPGAGKTIMAGLLIKELMARGDLMRCLVVCPGSLAEQWQDELWRRFSLPFEILTSDGAQAARTGNWFLEHNLVICRLDKLARNDDLQARLEVPDCRWDLIVCDEAHKLSATYFGGEVKYTKRYRLAQKLSQVTRHFLLMTATPHNGKEEDFQLFLALLDGDRFEGRFRDGAHTADASDLMRRMTKEHLLKFDATPLFPERIAYTVSYTLSDAEAALYAAVTDYVRQEFNRAEALQNDRRAGTVGFALTILQRRLASSPEAIWQSLRRRRERLEQNLRELELLQRGSQAAWMTGPQAMVLDPDDLEELEDAPGAELEAMEEEVLDRATAARTIEELRLEIDTLKSLEARAFQIRQSGEDRKWRELAELCQTIFTPAAIANRAAAARSEYEARRQAPRASPEQKLVIFTEQRDTLNYLGTRIRRLLGTEEAVVVIHGAMGREERLKAQEFFRNDPRVRVLIATDAAGEGINLQRAHLMVNYDLPWNPNRLEQRFGRIHRIGQTEVCHLWNLVAAETREGDVYRLLLEKLEQARSALGGQVFDVLGQLQFDGRPLRELLIEAIRYGDRPEVRARLTTVVDSAMDQQHIQCLLEDHLLDPTVMDASRVQRIREDMERAEARRLQPHYVECFFREAFQRLGGRMVAREGRRYEVTHVPAAVRSRDRLIGTAAPVLPRYERIAFDKAWVAPMGKAPADLVCPGHPLLQAVTDLTLEQSRTLLKQGAVLVDERDEGTAPRLLLFLEHAIQDGSTTRLGERRVVSKQLLFVEVEPDGSRCHLHYAPYLDLRALTEQEPPVAEVLAHPACAWVTRDIEHQAMEYAIREVVPKHLCEVKERRLALLAKTEAAVKDRLAKEIAYWDNRAAVLADQQASGKANQRLNAGEARRRAEELEARLKRRLQEIERERHLAALPPVVLGGVLVLPVGLLRAMSGQPTSAPVAETQASAARARAVVMAYEQSLGHEPRDVELLKLGYDVESRVPETGHLRFIEVKGRVAGAEQITVTRNEILYSFNEPEKYILAIVEFVDDSHHRLHYVQRPFEGKGITSDFSGATVNFPMAELLAAAAEVSGNH